MSSQYIFTMYKLSRTHPPDKQVLKDISLSFMPGAKIGVLGLNGSGKSTLLRIMAGQDTEYRGEAQLAPGATVGLLEQEPQLDESKDVRGNVEDGVRRAARAARPLQRARRELLRRDRGRVRAPAGADRRRRRLEPRHAARQGDGRAALPARRRRRHDALRRRAPPRRALPAAALAARPAAARRAHQPPRRRVGRPGSSSHLEEYKGTVVAVTHDRYFLDNVAGWILELDRGHGPPVQGQLLELARAEAGAARAGGRKDESARQRTIEQELEWVRENPKGRRKKAKARLNNYERLLAEDRNVKLDEVQIHIPAGPRLGDKVIEADGAAQGLRRPAADRGPLVHAAARRASSA